MRRIGSLLIATVLAAAPFAAAGDAEDAFAQISKHYESIRQALIKDATTGVSENARAIQVIARALANEFNVERAGVSGDDASAAREILPEVAEKAGELADTSGLEATRAALAELTKPLVRWHSLVQGERPVVAYCPMVKKPWLQPDEAIGNPYAPSMLRCGEVVAR